MGTYTSILVISIINKKYRDVIDYIDNYHEIEGKEWGDSLWLDAGKKFNIPLFTKFYEKTERSSSFPFAGNSACMWPDDIFDEIVWNKESGYWRFCCSLKNYCSESDYFIKILKKIADKYCVTYQYEEDDLPYCLDEKKSLEFLSPLDLSIIGRIVESQMDICGRIENIGIGGSKDE